MPRIDPVTPPGDAVDEAKAYLRIDNDDEDALLASFIATAIRQCEGFTGQILLRRGFVQRLPVSSAWSRLSPTLVVAVTSVTGIPAEGASFLLPVSAYAVDIDGNGDGWVRVTAPGAAARVDVAGTAGMASDWGGVPEALRQGVLRLVSHLHLVRDNPDDRGPPAAVAALWRPWRRMRLS